MQLSSSAFSNGSGIPRRFTCDGDDLSPPLDWEAAPAAAGSFVLLCDDPDAPAGKWHHWAVYDIHADQTGLAEGAGQDSDDVRFKQAINDFDRMGYGGPLPAPRPRASSLSLSFAGPFGQAPIARHQALLPGGRTRSAQACHRRNDSRGDLSAMTAWRSGDPQHATHHGGY
jgi:Raf kinase inhibitor-like YbhB/YbcL family protein